MTIPHKRAVIPLLDRLDETAAEIGAVNVVKTSHVPSLRGEIELVGYNTDCIGFMESIKPMLKDTDRRALVLGTGGAAKAMMYGLRKLGIEAIYVSRTPGEGMVEYKELTAEVMRTHTVIVNCTPLGMWPEVEGSPAIPYEWIGTKHMLFDCVYNPEETVFLRRGREQGARTLNGMGMLIGQADAAWKIWSTEQGTKNKDKI